MNMTLGLPRDKKIEFDPKLEEVEAPAFEGVPAAPTPALPGKKALGWVGIVISVFAAFATGWNSFEWWRGLRPIFIAVPMALAMVGASVLLPDFAILLWRSRKRALGALVMASGVMATLFCMTTTVAALYNSRSATLTSSAQEAKNATIARSTLLDLQSERKRLVGEVDRLNSQIDSTQGKIEGLAASETLGGVAQTLQNRLLNYQTTRQSYERQLEAVQASIAAARIQGGGQVARNDFFAFLSALSGADVDRVEFLVAAVPAVFLEVVAPIMVAVVIFL